MGDLDFLFGSESEAKTKPIYTPQQMALLNALSGYAQEGMRGGQPTSPMPPTAVPPTGLEQDYFDFFQGDALQNLLSGTPAYDVGPEWAEKYFEESVRPEYMKNYEEVTLPGVKSAYAGPGYWGSARAGAQAEAGEDLATQLSSKRAQLMYGEEIEKRKAFESAQDRMLPASAALGQAGGYQRGIAHEESMDNLQRFLRGESITVGGQTYQIDPEMGPYAQMAMQLLGFSPMQTVVEPGSPGLLGNLGLGLNLAV